MIHILKSILIYLIIVKSVEIQRSLKHSKISFLDVSCGKHTAHSCSECPKINSMEWCGGDCALDNSTNECTLSKLCFTYLYGLSI